MLLLLNAELRQRLIHRCRQRSQFGPALAPNPEHPRSARTRTRKESVATKTELERISRNCGQRSLNGLGLIVRLLSNELQRDVERFGPYPTYVGCKFAHALEETCDPAADVIVDINCNKETHKPAES